MKLPPFCLTPSRWTQSLPSASNCFPDTPVQSRVGPSLGRVAGEGPWPLSPLVWAALAWAGHGHHPHQNRRPAGGVPRPGQPHHRPANAQGVASAGPVMAFGGSAPKRIGIFIFKSVWQVEIPPWGDAPTFPPCIALVGGCPLLAGSSLVCSKPRSRVPVPFNTASTARALRPTPGGPPPPPPGPLTGAAALRQGPHLAAVQGPQRAVRAAPPVRGAAPAPGPGPRRGRQSLAGRATGRG